jgi:formate hydrogenlyase subunit 4
VIWVLLSLAFLLLADRKIWAGVQMRKGPNVVGPFGLLQSFADFFKFVLKEIVIPSGADKVVFLLAPLLSLVLAFVGWAVMPFAPGWVVSNLNVGILYLLAMSSLGVYGIIMGGWASNSKYPFLGALRSAAQMVSYEVSIGLIIITVILLAGSMNLSDHRRAAGRLVLELERPRRRGLKNISCAGDGHAMGMFFISALAETNRPPFDLPEAESELVAGYQVEYSSTPVPAVHGRRVFEHRPDVRADQRPVLRRLEARLPDRMDSWAPTLATSCWPGVLRQDHLLLLHDRHGQGHRASLPLRPADAPGLEGLPADLAGAGDAGRRLARLRTGGDRQNGPGLIAGPRPGPARPWRAPAKRPYRWAGSASYDALPRQETMRATAAIGQAGRGRPSQLSNYTCVIPGREGRGGPRGRRRQAVQPGTSKGRSLPRKC